MTRTFRAFISSPSDAAVERRRAENVIARLNGEFAGLARLVAIRWETELYLAHATFQTQIPPAADCDIVIGVLRWRLGTALPADFVERLPTGEPYPSGTAFELLTAIDKRKRGGELPDVYVFRYTGGSPNPQLDDPNRAAIEREWTALRGFFERWFVTSQGQFVAALNNYATEDQFEASLERALRKWLAEKTASGRAVPWPPSKGSPFRGLSVFGAKHAPVFFGRGGDVRRAVDLWREAAARDAPFLLIVGASGSGKSSLARAGLIARATTPGVVAEADLWRVAALRPSDGREGPFGALASALLQDEDRLPPEEEGRGPALPEIALGDYRTPADLAQVLSHGEAASARVVVNALDRIAESARGSGQYQRDVACRLMLLVDQLEELFAPSVEVETRLRFARLLGALVATGRVWMLATLRADRYGALLENGPLTALKSAGVSYDLGPPGAAELADIVRAPAAAAGLKFEIDPATGEGLDERLLREADRSDMLPLVQLALSRLWEARQTKGSEIVLTIAAYEKLGGLTGIVEEAGEAALAGLSDASRARLPALIRRLAEFSRGQAGAEGALTARAAPLAEAAPDAEAKALVDALAAARLLTLSEEGDFAQVRLAHQRVLADWRRAAAIAAESADFYRVRDEIEAQRRRWDAGGRRPDLLIVRGLPLAQALAALSKYGGEFTPEAQAFVAASRRRAQRAQMIGWALAVVFAALAIGSGLAAKVAVDQKAVAQAQKARADENFVAAKRTVDGLIFNIVQGLRNVAGMRVGTIKTILDTVKTTVDGLLATAPDDPQLLRSEGSMWENFASTYLAAGDLADASEAAQQSLAALRKVAALTHGDREAQRDVSVALERVGDVKLLAGDLKGALAAFNEELSVHRRLAVGRANDARAQRDLEVSLGKVGEVKARLGDRFGALAAYQEVMRIARALAHKNPGDSQARRDLAVGLNKVGDMDLQSGDRPAALAAFRESLGIAEALATAEPQSAEAQRDVTASLEEVAEVERQSGQAAEALADYRKSLAISRTLASQDPTSALAARDVMIGVAHVGEMETQAGKLKQAIADYQDALAQARKLVATDQRDTQAQRDVVIGLGRLGDAEFVEGDRAAAWARLSEALAISRKLATENPGDAQAQRDLSISLHRVGNYDFQTQDLAGATGAYREALDISRKLAARDAGDAQALRDLSVSLERLGDVQIAGGAVSAALAADEEDLSISRKLAAKDAGDAFAQRDVAVSLGKVGDVRLRLGDRAGARAAYGESLAISRKLLALNRADAQAQRDLSINLERMGSVYQLDGDVSGARAVFVEALALRRAVAKLDPGDRQAQHDLEAILQRLGDLDLRSGAGAAAATEYAESLGVSRNIAASYAGDAFAERDLAVALNRDGDAKAMLKQGAAALTDYEQALAIARELAAATKPAAIAQQDLLFCLNRVGDAKARLQDKAGALTLYEEALVLVRSEAASAKAGDVQSEDGLIVALFKVGSVAPPARARLVLTDALSRVDKLASEGQLTSAQKSWPQLVSNALAKAK